MKNGLPLLSISVLMLALPSGLGAPVRTPAPPGDEKLPAAMSAREGNGVPVRSVAHRTPVAAKPSPQEAYGKLPVQFEENRGQSDARVKYLARGRGYLFFVTPQETVLALRHGQPAPRRGDLRGSSSPEGELPSASSAEPPETVLRFELEGANAKPKVEAVDRLPGISNYFIGNDPAKWRTKIPNYAKVIVRDVYRGIDAVYYGKEGRLESDFIVAPGRDPRAIRLKITGAQGIEVNSAGDLALTTAAGEVDLAKPVLYQEVNGARREVAGGYKLVSENEAGFRVGQYDHGLPLVIDPTLVYSTYLGGSDPTLGDQVFAMAVDLLGEAYATGPASSADFPTQSPHQGTLGGTENAFITKFAANGTTLLFSTFLGGNNIDHTSAIALDAAGNAYIAGRTTSLNFPTMNPFQGALNGIADAFVAKLSRDGSMLIFSSYLGGSSNDDANGIAVDGSGNAYVVGFTNSSNFPVTTGVFQPGCGSCVGTLNNAYVAKISISATGTGTVTWATYLGGINDDEANAVAVDSSFNVHVTGIAHSANFPHMNAFQPSLLAGPGGSNAFVSELNPTGSALVFSTFLGGSSTTPNGDRGTGIAVDSSGNTVVTGVAFSTDFPVASTFQAHDPTAEDLFVAKFAPGGLPLLFSTLFGDESGGTEANALALDSSDNIYLTGMTSALFFPTLNPLQATTQAGSFLSADSATAFVLEIKRDASDYLFSTFLGGSQGLGGSTFSSIQDIGMGIAVDNMGNIYVGGSTATTDFPTVNPFQPTLKSSNSNGFVAKISPATPTGPQVFPAALNLGPSLPQIVTVANGTNTLTFTGITITGPNAADFTETDSCGPDLQPHVVCTIVITATPLGAGTRTATLMINDSDPSSPQMVPLTATGGTPPPPTGSITFSPSSLTFGPQEIGTSSGTPMTVTVNNTGSVTVNISISFTGPNRFEFFAATSSTCFFPLAVGSSPCTVDVLFAPAAVGNRTASLQLSGNFAGSPVSVTLSGTGTPQIAVLSPAFFNFPGQLMRTTSAPQNLTLTNTSTTVTVTGIKVTLSQSTTGVFAIISPPCGGPSGSLGPGGMCTISVTFTPGMAVSFSASITVTDSDPAFQFSQFNGNGLNPLATLTVSPSNLSFGRQNLGTTSPVNGAVLQNLGNTDLVFTVIPGGTDPGDFSATNNCGRRIPPGLICILSVTFTPLAVGPLSATLTISSNTSAMPPPPISLSGTGVTATTAALAPASLIFPNEPVGVASPAQLATFSNTGSRPLILTGGGLSGANPGDFSFRAVSNGEATVGCGSGASFIFRGTRFNPQVNCPISFVFTPTGMGTRTATFTIMDSSSNFPAMHTVVLQGSGGAGPAVSLTPPSVNFGTVGLGVTSSPVTITVMNIGTTALSFTATPSISGTNSADFTIVSNNCTTSVAVQPGSTCIVTVTFTPSMTATLESASLDFTDNATPATQSAPLSGMGSAIVPGVSISAISPFGNQTIGTTSAPQTVTIRVTAGTGTLNLTSITITPTGSGTGATDFAISVTGTTCPVTGGGVAGGTSCTISITFTPSIAGPESATLIIAGSNLTGSPVMLALTGTGVSTAAGFTLTVPTTPNGGNGSTVSVVPGDTAVFTVVLQPNPGFMGTITLMCGTPLPPNTICAVSPATINVTTSPSPPITITITLRTNCVTSVMGRRAPWPQSPAPLPAAPLTAVSTVALLLALWWRNVASRSFGTSGPSSRQAWAVRLIPLWATFVLLLLVMTWTACVSNSAPAIPGAPQTPPGVYQLPIIATAPGGVMQTLMLTIHVI